MVFPLRGQSGTIHDLNFVLAVGIRAVQSQADRFTVFKGESVDHGEILGRGVVISDGGGDVTDIAQRLQPAAVAGGVRGHNQLADALMDQIPVIAGVFFEYSFRKGGADFVGAFLCHKAVSTAGVEAYALAVDLDGLVGVAAVGGDGQLNGITYTVKCLISSNLAVCHACGLDVNRLTGIGDSIRYLNGVVFVSGVSVMLDTYGYYFIRRSYTFHGIGVHNRAVNANGQDIVGGTLHLKFCAAAID